MTDICSVMCVLFNRLDLSKRTFEGLKTSIDSPYRLCLVDNGSTDGTVEWLNSLHFTDFPHCVGLDIQLNQKNLGIATGRNQGLKMAGQHNDPWLATIDNDALFPNGWLKECIEFMKANKNFCIGVNMERKRYPLKTFNGKTIQYKEKGNLGTCCAVMPRSAHSCVGFFNTSLPYYGHDDADYFFRLRMVHFELGYIDRDGDHLGEGELDQGEYREFKNKYWDKNIQEYFANSRAYYRGEKKLYVPYSEQAPDIDN